MAWFWWFAPQAGKAGTLQILGTPSIVKEKIGGTDYWVTYISVRNAGNEPITVIGVTVKGVNMVPTDSHLIKIDSNYKSSLDPGQGGVIIAKNASTLTIGTTEYAVPCIIQTNYGVFTVTLSVVR
jgi:hypothetical protein